MTDDYRSRKALSAGVAWTMVNECPAQAWHESPWNPDRVERQSTEFDIGRATHLLVLEPHELADRVSIITAKDWRTQAARDLRDQAYVEGKTPLLFPRDWELVNKMRDRLQNSDAAELLSGDGLNEYAYYWEWDGVPCKAKADRIVTSTDRPGIIVDLKTAATAGPGAFQRAMIRDGHHLRAAWYADGLTESRRLIATQEYYYVVIAKAEPHIASVFRLDERALAWGRTLYRKAIRVFGRAQETGIWSGYGREGEKINTVSLPAFAENLLGAQERAGEFDDDEVSYD